MSDITAPAVRGRANSTSKGQKKEQRKKQQNKMEDDAVTCNACRRMFVDEKDKLLQCERCNMWNCIVCLKYSDAEYELLNARPDLHWYCDECQTPAIQAVQSDKEVVERCKYYMSQFTKIIDTLDKEMVNKADKVDVDVISKKLEELEKNGPPQAEALAIIEDTFVELRRYQEAIKRRRKNLIIYDVEEPTNFDDRDRRRVDEASATTILTKLSLQEIDLKAVPRLGKKAGIDQLK